MMIFIFIIKALSLKPVIFLPPLFGTNLHVSYDNIELPWYCPKSMNDKLIWIDPKLVVPPFYNCIFDLLEAFYDNETGKVYDKKGVDISVHDFGGDESVKYVDGGLFGFRFYNMYESMIHYFKDHGYVIGQNLFVAPYDWRYAPAAIYDFYPKFKELIEKAYEINGEKVTLMGFSLGGYSLHHFLTKKITNAWKHKYVEKVVLMGPSFGGSMDITDLIFDVKCDQFPFENRMLKSLSQGLPFMFSHLPNQEIYSDTVLIRGPNGENFTGKQIADLILAHDRIQKEHLGIMKVGVEMTKKAPEDVDLPTALIYNSGYPTTTFLDFKNGWDNEPVLVKGPGDGTIPAKSIEWVCQNWDHKKYPKICIDFDNYEERFQHQPMTRNPYVHELLFNLTARSDWTKKRGRIDIHMPYVQLGNNDTYIIRNDISPLSIRKFD